MDGMPTLLDQPCEETLNHCYPVFRFLRPHLDQPAFVERVQAQYREGYRIAYIRQRGSVAAVAGYRIATFLAWGRTLYIDDLATLPEVGRQGLGGKLLDWLIDQAAMQGCDEVHLDTGYQRHAAHRLYLGKGLQLSCHHLALSLKG